MPSQENLQDHLDYTYQGRGNMPGFCILLFILAEILRCQKYCYDYQEALSTITKS